MGRRGAEWDVVVAGAGPAGSATATLLARAGAKVLLLDRARFPRDKPCSEYLSPGATATLARLGGGALEAVAAAAPARLTGMRVVAEGGVEMTGRFEGRASFAVPRTTLDTILRLAAEAAGAVVREGVKVEALVGDGGVVGGVMTRDTKTGTGETHRARVVVGADGLRSVVARGLGAVVTSSPRRVAFAAHVRDVAGVADVGEMHLGAAGYVGLGPIGDGVTTVALVVPAARVRALDLPRRFFERIAAFPGLAGRFDPARTVRGILATGPFAQWARRPFAAGRTGRGDTGALLVGDAADFFDPFTGQGIYSALRGAELAAATLLSGAPLRAYALARRREFAGKWLIERLVALGVGWPALARRVVARLARRPALADLFVGCTGSYIPARRLLTPAMLARLLW